MFSLDRDKDVICATATAPGEGAIAVVRVSGPHSAQIVRKIAKFLPQNLESHRAYYGHITEATSNTVVDEVITTFFEHGRSFTGEETFEISCHGSPAVIQSILNNLVLAGARPAERGEFTYRAFINGKVDLSQAEAILNLVQSQSLTAARIALRQLNGELSNELALIEDDLTWSLSRLEANIDFSSEDIEFAPRKEILNRVLNARRKVESLVNSYQSGRVIKEGLYVVLVGSPNVGKSSLLNALTLQDRSIVTSLPGTTRDIVEVDFEINGIKVILADTAGLRESSDEVEKIGISKTKRALDLADIILHVVDAARTESTSLFDIKLSDSCKVIRVINKVDLIKHRDFLQSDIAISTITGEGLAKLKDAIFSQATKQSEDGAFVISNARHYDCLQRVLNFICVALNLLEQKASDEFVISELQQALLILMQITGKQFDDEVLDRVFKEFCLGK